MTGERPLPFVLVERAGRSPRVAVVRVAPDRAGRRFPAFEAGQHVRVSVPGPGGTWSRRPLSVASPPEEARWLEFLVSRSGSVEDPFVERFLGLSPGDRLSVSSEGEGRLTTGARLAPEDPRALVLAAAGTGIAPFASMVRSWAARGDRSRLARTVVLHGATRPEDLVCGDQLLDHLGEDHYRPTVSRAAEEVRWGGAIGRVEAFFEPGRIEDVERALGLGPGGLVPAHAVVFVCGFPGTVSAVAEALRDRGYRLGAEALFTET